MAKSGIPTLSELQDAFQKAVIDGDGAILGHIPPNTRTSNDVLLGVYRHAYVGRLVEIVGNDYERLRALMGGDAFAAMARSFVKAHLSNTPNARWYAWVLPEFLAATGAYRERRELAELAAIERALADAFDAADAEPATIDALRALPPELWADLMFTPHPSARRLDQSTNAFAIWQALNSDEEPPPAGVGDEVTRLLVWRQEATSKARVLGAEEAMLWDEASKGVTFGALCELSAHFDDPGTAALRVAQLLQGWLHAGLISGASLAARATGADTASALK